MELNLNLAAFRAPAFRLYFIGNAFSLHGLWIQRVTIGWLAWELSGTGAVVGWVAFLTFAPVMITGPFFGALIDRMEVRPAAMAVQGSLAALSLTMAALYSADALGLTGLSALALAIGIVTSAHHPVRMSFAPLLAPAGAITSVVAATSINFNVARMVGPALGGALIANWGVGAALWAVVACALPYQAILPFLTPRPRNTDGPRDANILAGLRAGLLHAWRTRFIRRVLILTGTFAVIGRGLLEILPLVADGLFQRGPAGLGVLTSAAGLGALAGAVLVVTLPPSRAETLPPAARAAAAGGIVLSPLIVFSSNWPLTVLAVGLLGTLGTVIGVTMQTSVQQVLRDDMRGRVMSLWVMVGIGGAALGSLGLGAAADIVGLPTATGVAAMGCATVLFSLARTK
ncbi:MAG: MFS transporter [Pseudomonadota bacterium]